MGLNGALGSPFQGLAFGAVSYSLGVAQGFVGEALRASNVQNSGGAL